MKLVLVPPVIVMVLLLLVTRELTGKVASGTIWAIAALTDNRLTKTDDRETHLLIPSLLRSKCDREPVWY